MDYLMLGEKIPRGGDYRTAREVKVRKKQVCSWCTKEINKGERAVVCYTLEDNFNPFGGRPTKQEKQYLHENCVDEFANAINNGELDVLEIL